MILKHEFMDEQLKKLVQKKANQLKEKYSKKMLIHIETHHNVPLAHMYSFILTFYSKNHLNEDRDGISFSVDFWLASDENSIKFSTDIAFSDGLFVVDNFIEEEYSVYELSEEQCTKLIEKSANYFNTHIADIEKSFISQFL